MIPRPDRLWRTAGAMAVSLGACGGAQAQLCDRVWRAIPGADATINALLALPNGDLVAGGDFLHIGGVRANRIALWNGGEWSPLGEGFNAPVTRLVRTSDGDIIAGGEFWMTGQAEANSIARWDGTAWHAMGDGLPQPPTALAATSTATYASFFVSRGFGLLSWDGASWDNVVPPTQFSAYVARSLAVGDDDTLYVGTFAWATAPLLEYSEEQWSFAGCWFGDLAFCWISNVLPVPDLGVLMGGYNDNSGFAICDQGRIVRPLGRVSAQAGPFALLPDGQPVATIGQSLLRWDGRNWRPMTGGIVGGAVRAIAASPNGDLYIGGAFTHVDNLPAQRIAVWTCSECAADCDHSTGAGVLDIFDFLCFQNRFADADVYACDCDVSTGPRTCDLFDFLCFQNAFTAGCP